MSFPIYLSHHEKLLPNHGKILPEIYNAIPDLSFSSLTCGIFYNLFTGNCHQDSSSFAYDSCNFPRNQPYQIRQL